MDQRYRLEDDEPVSSEELRALIERFGERQAGGSEQPTIKDVAETLQVEPKTVAAMLHQLREAKSQGEIKERLDRLERENAELRARSESDFPILGLNATPRHPARRMLVLGSAMLVAIGIVMMSRARVWEVAMFIPLLLIVAIGLYFFKTRFADRRRR